MDGDYTGDVISALVMLTLLAILIWDWRTSN